MLFFFFSFFFWLHHTACGILVPQPGIEPVPLQWKHGILTTGPPGNSQPYTFKLLPSLLFRKAINTFWLLFKLSLNSKLWILMPFYLWNHLFLLNCLAICACKFASFQPEHQLIPTCFLPLPCLTLLFFLSVLCENLILQNSTWFIACYTVNTCSMLTD